MKIKALVLFGILMLILPSTTKALFESTDDCPTSKEGSKHGNLGARLWANGQLADAEKETREAIRIDDDCSMWRQNLGVILTAAGRADEARDSWLKSLELNNLWCTGKRFESLYGLGYYYYERRDFKKSIKFFEKTMSDPEFKKADDKTKATIFLEASYNYTELRESGNPFYDLSRAEDLKMRALRLRPDNQFIKASIAKLLVLQGKIGLAQRSIEELTATQSKSPKPNPGVYSYLGHIYSLLKDPENSAHYMMKAMDADPGQGKYLLSELDKDFKQVASSKQMQPVIQRARELSGQ